MNKPTKTTAAAWWDALSEDHKAEYVAEHPGSKYAEMHQKEKELRELKHSKPKEEEGPHKPGSAEEPKDLPAEGEDTPSQGDEAEKELEKHHKEKVTKSLHDTIQSLHPEQKEFFTSGGTKAGSKIRKSVGDHIAKSAGHIVGHFKKQSKEWKHASVALGKLMSGKKLDAHESAALKATAAELSTLIATTALTGGSSIAAHGVGLAAVHIGQHFFTEAFSKIAANGVLHVDHADEHHEHHEHKEHAMVTASTSEEKLLEKLIKEFAEHLANGDISEETWLKVAKEMGQNSKPKKEHSSFKLEAAARLRSSSSI